MSSSFSLTISMTVLTILVFWLGRKAYIKSGLNPLMQPVILGSAVMICALLALDISYSDYFSSVQAIHWFLAPSLVGLAIPLFYESKHMREQLKTILLVVCAGGVVTVLVAVLILWLFGSSEDSVLSMLTKSVTTAVAILVSDETGAIASLAAGFVLITGAAGAIMGPFIFKKLNVEDDESKGLALGLSAHAIGTVKAFDISPKCGAYSILAMIINGIFTAILLPICFWLF